MGTNRERGGLASAAAGQRRDPNVGFVRPAGSWRANSRRLRREHRSHDVLRDSSNGSTAETS